MRPSATPSRRAPVPRVRGAAVKISQRSVSKPRFRTEAAWGTVDTFQKHGHAMSDITKVNLRREAAGVTEDWKNWVLADVNDHVVRISVMTRDFHWHRHSNSDEVLLALEGSLIVDFEDGSITAAPGEFVRVPRDVLHRTRPAGERVVTLSFEHRDTAIAGD